MSGILTIQFVWFGSHDPGGRVTLLSCCCVHITSHRDTLIGVRVWRSPAHITRTGAATHIPTRGLLLTRAPSTERDRAQIRGGNSHAITPVMCGAVRMKVQNKAVCVYLERRASLHSRPIVICSIAAPSCVHVRPTDCSARVVFVEFHVVAMKSQCAYAHRKRC